MKKKPQRKKSVRTRKQKRSRTRKAEQRRIEAQMQREEKLKRGWIPTDPGALRIQSVARRAERAKGLEERIADRKAKKEVAEKRRAGAYASISAWVRGLQARREEIAEERRQRQAEKRKRKAARAQKGAL